MLGDYQYADQVQFVLRVNGESSPVAILLARARVPPHQVFHDVNHK